jgi:hypothetical protein
MPADQRKVIGATVHALAAHVTALYECTRRYGSNNRKKLLDGVVIRVDTKRTQTRRSSTTVVAEYQLGSDGVTKTKGINIRSVKAGAAPLPPPAPTAPAPEAVVPAAAANHRRDDTATDATTATEDSSIVAPVATATVETAAAAEEGTAGDPVVQHADEPQNGGPGDLPEIRDADPNADRNLRGGGAAAPVEGPDTAVPLTAAHGQEWFELSEETIKLKSVPRRQWKMTNLFGEDVYPNSPASLRMSRLDFFLLMFPENQLDEMVTLTNRELKKRGAPDLTNC